MFFKIEGCCDDETTPFIEHDDQGSTLVGRNSVRVMR